MLPPQKGRLIVFEGVNGAGKTSLIEKLVAYFNACRIPCSAYKFPNRNGKLGTAIDDYLQGKLKLRSKYDILSLFAADRAQVAKQLQHDLEIGKVVFCDRYVFSAIAYHTPSRVTDPTILRRYCSVIGYFDKDLPMPDITFLIKGDHLQKRGIISSEIFHFKGRQNRQMAEMLRNVINQYSTRLVTIKNETGNLDAAVLMVIEAISEW